MPRNSSTQEHSLRATKQPTGYHLGMQMFPTKQAITDAIRTMLATYEPDTIVRPADEAVLLDLLAHHPRAYEKIGVGIKRIRVRVNPTSPTTRMFWLERLDGTAEDFSYIKCLRPVSLWERVTRALRLAISPQIVERKTRVFGGRDRIQCPVTDQRCAWEEMHVDHRPPLTFVRLAEDFLIKEWLFPHQVALAPAPDGIGYVLADVELCQRWQDWHAAVADLWVISIAAHVELTRQRLRASVQDK